MVRVEWALLQLFVLGLFGQTFHQVARISHFALDDDHVTVKAQLTKGGKECVRF